MEKGFIKLSRKFFENDIWLAARTFNDSEAWLDLIRSARFEATEITSRVGGREITWGRGQYPASVRFLAKQWKWGERKVRYFLDRLKREGMITTDDSQGMTIITLCNYEIYNGYDTPKDTRKDTANVLDNNTLQAIVTQVVTQLRTQQPNLGHSRDTNNKKDNNTSKEDTTNVVSKKDAAIAATLARKESFKESLDPYKETYGESMIQEFFEYWTEMNKSHSKMRFEQQKTWETPRRLKTWANRENNFKNKSYGNSTTGNSTSNTKLDEDFYRNVAEGCARGSYQREQRGEY